MNPQCGFFPPGKEKCKRINLHHYSFQSYMKTYSSNILAQKKGLRRFIMLSTGHSFFSVAASKQTNHHIHTYKKIYGAHYTRYGIWVIMIPSHWSYIYIEYYIVHKLCLRNSILLCLQCTSVRCFPLISFSSSFVGLLTIGVLCKA